MVKFRAIFHFFAFSVFVFAMYYDVNILGWIVFEKYEKKPTAIPWKGRLMFLTVWNMVKY